MDKIEFLRYRDFINETSIPEPPKPELNPKFGVLKKNFDPEKLSWNGDGTWDYHGDIKLSVKKFESFEELGLPKIRKVYGSFMCEFCSFLRSFEGGPEEVTENFSCSKSATIVSLMYTPSKVLGYANYSSMPALCSHQGIVDSTKHIQVTELIDISEMSEKAFLTYSKMDVEDVLKLYSWLEDSDDRKRLEDYMDFVGRSDVFSDENLRRYDLYDSFYAYDDVVDHSHDLGWD